MSKAENDRAFEEWFERDADLAAVNYVRQHKLPMYANRMEAWHAACAYMAERAALLCEKAKPDAWARDMGAEIRKLVEE